MIASLLAGMIVGAGIPAIATNHPLSGSVTTGTYKYYYGTWRYHGTGPASFRLDSASQFCGGAVKIGMWDGYGGETPMRLYYSTGVSYPFQWPTGSGYTTTLPAETYAMIDGSTGGGCGGNNTIYWTGLLSL